MDHFSNRLIIFLIFLLGLVALIGCPGEKNISPLIPEQNPDPFAQNKLLRKTINLGNALEAPNEGDWGVVLKAEYFKIIHDVGFTAVRIPIRWSAHAAIDSPYTIDNQFFSRVDWAIHQAFNNDLAAVINIHHYEEIMENPVNHKQRFLSLWRQIADRYKNLPNTLIFELLNEPHGNFTPELWNEFLAEAIAVIRDTNPNRTLMVGTASWGGLSSLNDLQIPEADTNVIFTFHYYEPFHFTHQGAEWVSGSDAWLGTTWSGKPQEQIPIIQDFERVRIWAETHHRPVFLGEFGAYSKADMASRYAWTSFVAREAERRNFSWGYWEFCAGFGIYDKNTGEFNELLRALIP